MCNKHGFQMTGTQNVYHDMSALPKAVWNSIFSVKTESFSVHSFRCPCSMLDKQNSKIRDNVKVKTTKQHKRDNYQCNKRHLVLNSVAVLEGIGRWLSVNCDWHPSAQPSSKECILMCAFSLKIQYWSGCSPSPPKRCFTSLHLMFHY